MLIFKLGKVAQITKLTAYKSAANDNTIRNIWYLLRNNFIVWSCQKTRAATARKYETFVLEVPFSWKKRSVLYSGLSWIISSVLGENGAPGKCISVLQKYDAPGKI